MTEEVEFKIINSNRSPEKKLMLVPYEGDMNYLFLSLSQARYLLNELDQSLKRVSPCERIDDIVVPFPKEANND